MLLSYCTNVHPAEDLEGVLDQLGTYAGPVRAAAGLDRLGVGLWLPAPLAKRLRTDRDALARLRATLDANRLTAHTLNAFPYQAFHAKVVKRAVYFPTWAERARLNYVLDCAHVLAALLPPGTEGSISTLPLAWRAPWTPADDDESARALATASRELRDLAAATGRVIRLAIEPEPGCVLDTVDDVVAWLAARTGPSVPAGRRIDPEYVGVCLDTCHLAVSFADPSAAVRRITSAGLRVVKVQASAALHVETPSDAGSRAAVARYAEDRYLHQVRELAPGGEVLAADDLPEALGAPDAALPGTALPGRGPWRVHFHVPLHHDPAPPLAATPDVLTAAVAAVRTAPHGDEAHLDVETYTWSVLPEGADERGTGSGGAVDLVAGIAAELRWAVEHLGAGNVAANQPAWPPPGATPDEPSSASPPGPPPVRAREVAR